MEVGDLEDVSTFFDIHLTFLFSFQGAVDGETEDMDATVDVVATEEVDGAEAGRVHDRQSTADKSTTVYLSQNKRIVQ